MDFVLFCYIQQDQILQNVPEVQGVRWDRVFHLIHLCQQVRLVQVVPTETASIESKRSADANKSDSIWNNTLFNEFVFLIQSVVQSNVGYVFRSFMPSG